MGRDQDVTVVAGIGLRRGCPAAEIVALVRRAAEAAGRVPSMLAAPTFKAGEIGLIEAAAALGLALVLVERDALVKAQAGCVSQSAAALRSVGVGSVAEASALAASGPGATLLLPRIKSGAATCALAAAP